MEQTEEFIHQPKLQPVLILRGLCLGLLVGFIIGYWVIMPLWLITLAFCLVGILIFLKNSKQLVVVFVIGCLIALLRGNGLESPPANTFFIGQQEITAQIIELPRLSERTTKYVVKVLNQPVAQKVLINNLTWPEYFYGDTLRIKCDNVEIVRFTSYTNKGIWRSCSWPETTLIKSADSGIRFWLYQSRRLAGDKIRQAVPEPFATLTTGMLWGDDSGLAPDLTKNFQRTGTSHLLAVSGFNVMILTRVLFWFLIGLGLWRRQAGVAVLLLTVLFVIFSGAEPSVVRAGAMGIILLIGQMLARQPNNFNVLAGTASAMLLITPSLLVDLGWQLSFAAMVGLSYLSPVFRQKLIFLPNFLSIKQSASETLAATLLTTPIILLRLGQMSVITPIANLLVSPVIVLVYWFGLSLLLLSLFSQTVAMPAAWLLVAVLYYLTKIVSWLSVLPWSAVSTNWLSWLLFIIVYLSLGIWLLPSKFIKKLDKVRQ